MSHTAQKLGQKRAKIVQCMPNFRVQVTSQASILENNMKCHCRLFIFHLVILLGFEKKTLLKQHRSSILALNPMVITYKLNRKTTSSVSQAGASDGFSVTHLLLANKHTTCHTSNMVTVPQQPLRLFSTINKFGSKSNVKLIYNKCEQPTGVPIS